MSQTTPVSRKRPLFRRVSPHVYFSSLIFAILNLLFLAPAFFVANGAEGLVLVGEIPSYMWGLIFVGLGTNMVAGLVLNHWTLIKVSLILGLLVKALFAWALVFTLFSSFSNIGIVGIWFAIMGWQGLCIVYFTPEMKYASHI